MAEHTQDAPASQDELELQELEEMSAPGFWEGVSIGVTIVSTIIAAT